MNFYKMEFHAHTEHSDGAFSPEELVAEAARFGYDILSITDHNTITGYEAAAAAHQEGKPLLFPGIEWTTFYGHVLVLGSKKLFDWQNVRQDTFDEAVTALNRQGALVGLAHPFALGSPFCTGCHWDFTIEKWEQIAFIEVWNRENPLSSFRSQLAYELWLDRLAEGYHISCSAGRDWHRLEADDRSTAVTYIGLAECQLETVHTSVEQGNFYITMGPTLKMSCQAQGKEFQMGETVPAGKVSLEIEVGLTDLERLQQFQPVAQEVRVYHGAECLATYPLSQEQKKVSCTFEAQTYFRLEVWGRFENLEETPLTLSNPWYV